QLADNANDDGVSWYSVPRMADRCGMSERALQGHIKELVSLGLLLVRDRPGTSRVYHLQYQEAQLIAPQNLRPTPAESAPPPPQNLRPTPAESAEDPNNEPNKVDPEKEKQLLSGKPDCVDVINHLNDITGARYLPSAKASVKHISGRLSDGHSIEDLKAVIDFKAEQWGADPKMAEYLRPQTLFCPEKFPGYLTRAKGWIAAGRPRFINGEWEGFEGKRKPMSNIAAAQQQARSLIESGAVSYDDDTPL
ncbi:MAG: conserved phage C-terminal domain-containing protein, partial [Aeromonas sp.]